MIFYILHQNIPDIATLVASLKFKDNSFIYKPDTVTIDDFASAYNKFISNDETDKSSITILFIYKNSHEYNIIDPFNYTEIVSTLVTLCKPSLVNIITDQLNCTDKLKELFNSNAIPLLYSTKRFYKLTDYVLTNSYFNGTENTLDNISPVKLYFDENLTYSEYLGCGAGYSHTAIVNNLDNKLYSWGNNQFNQLGKLPTKNVEFTEGVVLASACGNAHTAIVIKKDNKNVLLTYGNNEFGQLGKKDENGFVILDGNPVYVTCGFNHTAVIVEKNKSRSLVLFGDNANGQCDMTKVSDNVLSVDCGFSHTAVLTEHFNNIRLTVFGNNDYGQLCDKLVRANHEIPIAVSCGRSHTAVITDKEGVKTLYTFGNNDYGQLGTRDASGKVLNITPVKVVCGYNHTLVIAEKEGVQILYSFGSNEFGQLGIKYNIGSYTSTPEQVILSAAPKFVACGSSHTVVATTDNKLYVFGSNKYGELGVADNMNTFLPNYNTTELVLENMSEVSNISAGNCYTTVVGVDNTNKKLLYSFGNNDYGQLKRSTIDMAVDLEGTPIATCWGKMHTCVITQVNNKNRLLTFGNDDFGQLGKEIVENSKDKNCSMIACGKYHTVALLDKKVVAFGNNDYGQINIPVINDEIVALACGSYHTAIITKASRVYLIGLNKSGQCKLIPPNLFDGRVIDVACGESHTLLRTNRNTVYYIGNNDQQQIECPTKDKVSKMSCGNFHTAVLTIGNKLLTFGDNTYNQLVPQDFVFDGTVVDVKCGDYYTLVYVKKDGLISVYGTGANWYGQLGFDPIKFNVIATPTFICYTDYDTKIYDKLTYKNGLISCKFVGDALVKVFNYQANAKFITKSDVTTVKDYTITDDSLYKKSIDFNVGDSYILSYNLPEVVVLSLKTNKVTEIELTVDEINIDEFNIDNLKDVITQVSSDKTYLRWFVTTYKLDTPAPTPAPDTSATTPTPAPAPAPDTSAPAPTPAPDASASTLELVVNDTNDSSVIVDATPVKEAVKAEPVKQAVKAEPVKQAVKAEPVKQAVKAEPVKQDVKAEPVKQDVKAESVKQDVKTESVKEVVKAEPVKQAVKAEPVKEAVKAEPVKQDVKTEPVKEDVKTESVKEAVKAEPVKEAQAPKPTVAKGAPVKQVSAPIPIVAKAEQVTEVPVPEQKPVIAKAEENKKPEPIPAPAVLYTPTAQPPAAQPPVQGPAVAKPQQKTSNYRATLRQVYRI